LVATVNSCTPYKNQVQYAAKAFQALRLEVNKELDVLKEALLDGLDVLNPGGRLVVISYHSLEDRLVKNFFKSGNFEGKIDKDFFGNINTPWDLVTRKAVVPSENEILENNRARSAKLRIAQKR
jgi:16S rRNA (cytosine1402-N4)-methyltransferase